MTDFITIVQDFMEERGEKIETLFINNIISKNTFYKYRKRNPSLKTLIKIANYLQVSIDYLYEKSDQNRFLKYSTNQSDFYNKLIELIKSSNISNRQFCKDLHYSKDNILRYRNGVEPSVQTLVEVADYFNCNIDDLLTKER